MWFHWYIKIISFNIWLQCVVWNFESSPLKFHQQYHTSIHWTMCILFRGANLRAVIFTSSELSFEMVPMSLYYKFKSEFKYFISGKHKGGTRTATVIGQLCFLSVQLLGVTRAHRRAAPIWSPSRRKQWTEKAKWHLSIWSYKGKYIS